MEGSKENIPCNLSQQPSTGKQREVERTKWVRGLELLVRKAALLGAECTVPTSLGSVSKELEQEKRDFNQSWRRCRQELHDDVHRVEHLVKSMGNMLENVEPGKAYVEALSSAMDAIEKEVVSIKNNQRVQFDELAKKEHLLSRDLELVVETLTTVAENSQKPESRPDKHGAKKPPHCSSWIPGCTGSGVLPEVLEYDEYLEAHGETGGWHLQDHKEFLRVLKVCKGVYAVALEMCCDEMIGYTRQDIINHCRWHSVLVELASQKKVAIACWRSEKEAAKAKKLQEAACISESASKALANVEQKDIVERLKREVQREMVKEWRDTKNREEQEKRLSAQQSAAALQARRKRETSMRQEISRTRIKDYRQKKHEEQRAVEAAAMSARAAQQPAPASPRNLGRIKERNKALVERKQEREKAHAAAEKERQERLIKLKQRVRVDVARDPTRVLKATEALVLKKKALGEEERRPVSSGYIRHVQHRAQPSWCRSSIPQ